MAPFASQTRNPSPSSDGLEISFPILSNFDSHNSNIDLSLVNIKIGNLVNIKIGDLVNIKIGNQFQIV